MIPAPVLRGLMLYSPIGLPPDLVIRRLLRTSDKHICTTFGESMEQCVVDRTLRALQVKLAWPAVVRIKESLRSSKEIMGRQSAISPVQILLRMTKLGNPSHQPQSFSVAICEPDLKFSWRPVSFDHLQKLPVRAIPGPILIKIGFDIDRINLHIADFAAQQCANKIG